MADHIEYAVSRIKNHEQISNPLTEDIRILIISLASPLSVNFCNEYIVSSCRISIYSLIFLPKPMPFPMIKPNVKT